MEIAKYRGGEMKLRYRIQTVFQYILFAFYPKATLLTCVIAALVIGLVLGIALMNTSRGSVSYDALLAVMTGATASFLVAIIVELSSNYKSSRLAWHELQEYYRVVTDYESMKRILMRGLFLDERPGDGAEDGARESECADCDEGDAPKDIVQATWKQLPEIMPTLKRTVADKKAFLTEKEIFNLEMLVFYYDGIRHEVAMRFREPLLFSSLNHPDVGILYAKYPKNVVDEMPDWIRQHVASSESQDAIEALVNAIMSDGFLLAYYMRDYDISAEAAERDGDLPGEWSDGELSARIDEISGGDPDYWDDDVDEKTFRTRRDELGQLMEVWCIPHASWRISVCCLRISECIDELEKEILRKPYYGLTLKFHLEKED